MREADRRARYVGLTAAIVGAGLLCRWPALGLPWFVAKYSGSVLWGAMVHVALRAIHPRARISASVTAAISIAIGVEFFRLYHQPGLDAFRATLAGQLLLGRVFSFWNLVAYAIGIACIALGDTVSTPIASRISRAGR